MNNFNLISKSVMQKLATTLALLLISGSLYAGGGIWNNNSKNNKSGNSKNMFSKKHAPNKKGKKSGKGGKHGGGKRGGKNCKPTSSVPLDGGLSILLLGAAAFGVKKLRDNS